MGWFNQKKGEMKESSGAPKLPSLPKIPSLPEFKEEKKEKPSLKPINQLPSFPTSTLGEKFSQDTIKDAVSGKKEVGGIRPAEELPTLGKPPMMQAPPKKTMTREIGEDFKGVPTTMPKTISQNIPQEFNEAATMVKTAGPIFIRIDKFEESLKTFEKAKNQIKEIEQMLKDIKRIKEEEDQELDYWEKEMQTIKNQIEKVDKDIFSKIE